ncbi:hypothetical protein LguiA_024101 [Lonicera macranthoides]
MSNNDTSLQRNGKSCRLRWINYLRPGLKRGMFTIQEEQTILTLRSMLGNKWSQMAHCLPGRTDNEVKNYWHSYLKKKVTAIDNNVDYAISNMDNIIECSSSSSLKSITQNPSFNSFERTEGSLTTTIDILPLVPQVFNSPKEDGLSNLPKLLFSDWLSMDQFRGHHEFDINPPIEPYLSKDAFGGQYYHEFQDSFISGELLNDGSIVSDEINQQAPSNSSAENAFHSQLKFSDEFCDGGCVGFGYRDNLCGDFNETQNPNRVRNA